MEAGWDWPGEDGACWSSLLKEGCQEVGDKVRTSYAIRRHKVQEKVHI